MSVMSRLDLVAEDLLAKATLSLEAGEKSEDVAEAVYSEFRNYVGMNADMEEWVREQAKLILKEAEKKCKP